MIKTNNPLAKVAGGETSSEAVLRLARWLRERKGGILGLPQISRLPLLADLSACPRLGLKGHFTASSAPPFPAATGPRCNVSMQQT